ncbi:MAG: TonB-dependent receptor [Betaproteobacteria bacterium]
MQNRHLLLKKTWVAQALFVAFGAATLTMGVSTTAIAQSNTTGIIFGQAAAGTTVVIENLGTGAKRTVSPDATGRFQATALPPGVYKAQLMKGGTAAATMEVEVLIGQGAEVKFADAASLATVQVVGRRQAIDVSSSNNGASFTAKQLEQLPIAKDVAAIIQLAPNTTRGDPRYNGAASFGGSASTENSYYINGFPVTNPLNQMGSSQLPFGAIAQAQVLTGGFGAEFGRSIGGVVNITTKSGTNEWEAGVSGSVTPSALRSKEQDIYYSKTGDSANALTDGTLYRRQSQNTRSESSLGAYLGGPIIKDKLFMFLAVESIDATSGVVNLPTASIATGDVTKWGWSDRKDTSTRFMGKFDWNLTDNHRLELTLIGDESKRNEKLSGYNYTTGAKTGVVGFTADYTNVYPNTPVGMNDQILKYTGNFSDDLTLTALYGTGQSAHSNVFAGGTGGGSLYTVSLVTPTAAAPGLTYNNPQPLSGNQLPVGANDKVSSFRLDLEYRLGQHTIRAGLDDNKLKSYNAGDFFPGGGAYTYRFTASPNTFKPTSSATTVAAGGGLGTTGYYARERIFTDVTDAFSDQTGQYIEDRYQATKNLLVTAGLRNESFANKNNLGMTFLQQKDVLSPRLGAAWDVNGDSSFKVFGSAGRYSVQIPTHLAVRGAGPSTYLQQYFTYTGIGPDGAPIGRHNLGPQVSPDGEIGTPKDPNVLASTNLKPNQQDELSIGFEKAFSAELNFGAKMTYRKMLATIDDYCDQTPIDNYAAAHGIDASNYGGFNCASVNPGLTNILNVDYSGTGKNYTKVTLTAADMGFGTEPAKRTYFAVDVFAEHPLKNGWYGKVNYTYSRSRGNTEGQTLSDIGQTDVAATQAWDFGQLMENSYGPLPNDRTHQIKAYGFYNVGTQWSIGANLLIASGRPRSCIGAYAGVNGDPGYGSATHYCNGVASPRGSIGNLPWDERLDMNLVYKPEMVKGLSLKVDVFNLFNKQHVEAVEETHNTGGTGTPILSTYERVLSYTAPRTVKLTAEYNYKF